MTRHASTARSALPGLWSFSRATASAFGARAAGAAIMLYAQIEIARRVGAEGAGRVATALAVVGVLAVLGRFGSDQLVMRRVATRESATLVRLDYAQAVRLSLPLLVALGALLFVLSAPLADLAFSDPSGAPAIRWLAPALPAFGLVAVQGEAIKGLGRPGLGAATQSLVGPVVTVALLWAASSTTSIARISMTVAAGFVASSLAAHLVWHRIAGAGRGDAVAPGAAGGDQHDATAHGPASGDRHDTLGFAREAWPFFGTSIFALVLAYTPVLALALLGDPADVGRYFAADRWTQIPAMLLVAVNAVVGPRFAVLWAGRRTDDVCRLLLGTTAVTACLATVVSLVIVAGAPLLLGLFGPGYESAVPALRVLGVAQFVILASGPVTSLLVMAGGERSQRVAAAVAAASVVLLALVLVPSYGLTGAAGAGAVAVVVNKALIIAMLRSIVNSTAASRAAVPSRPES